MNMLFRETTLQDAVIIEPELSEDDRGFFARSFCKMEFERQGLDSTVVQNNISYNHKEGTLRGMHFQLEPHREVKIVRCTRGAIFDVIVDLREDSPTFMKWIGVELTATNRLQLYVPAGFAHGYQTLEDGSEVFYQVSEFYTPGSERGVRWDDPAFNISWPREVTCISDKDRNHPAFAI